MSQQLVAATKKRKQPIITSFFKAKDGSMMKKPHVETIIGGHLRTIDCGYCGQPFTPQGISAHELWHSGQGHVSNQSRPHFGKVKVVGGPHQNDRFCLSKVQQMRHTKSKLPLH